MTIRELPVADNVTAAAHSALDPGLNTTPVELNVFIINALARTTPMTETFRRVMPPFAVEFLRIALLLAFPVLVLTVPRLLAG